MAASTSGVKSFLILLAVAAVIAAAALVYLVMRPKAVSIPANVAVLAADTAGFRGYFLGSDSAPVEVSEYADFQCPACQAFETVQFPSVRQQLIETGQVRWRYRDFPLAQHPHSRVASHAAACANDQGKYWELHASLYEHQSEWFGKRDASGSFRDYARTAGLDVPKYDECMQSAKYAGRIQASVDEGTKLGVASTPTFLIGSRLYAGALSSDSLRALVRALSAKPAP
jgi:protein-disulfide isomerase